VKRRRERETKQQINLEIEGTVWLPEPSPGMRGHHQSAKELQTGTTQREENRCSSGDSQDGTSPENEEVFKSKKELFMGGEKGQLGKMEGLNFLVMTQMVERYLMIAWGREHCQIGGVQVHHIERCGHCYIRVRDIKDMKSS